MADCTATDLGSLARSRFGREAVCAVFLLLAGSGPAIAADDEAGKADGEGRLLGGVMEWIDTQQSKLSERVASSALAIDRFFATEEYLQDTTESYLQLVVDQRYDTRDDLSGDVKVRGKLDLPGTQRRFTLLISGVTDEWLAGGDPLADTGGQGALTLERNPRGDASGWQIRPGVGVKGGWPPDPFVQVRATRHDDLGERWSMRTQGSARYLVDDKWDLRGDFSLVKVVDERWTGRIRTDIGWQEVDGFARASQSFDLFARVSERVGIRHTVAVSGDDETHWRVNQFGYRFGWRRLIHSDWLHMEINPEVYFPREDDFEAAAAVHLRFEAFAGRYR
jgi:hypothetical protein